MREGSHRKTKKSFAIKIVTKAKLSEEDEIALKDEIEILEKLKHRHIIRLYDVFEEEKYYYMVTEKMSGGELFDRIVQKSYYNEKEARDVCIILFDAMKYIHEHKVAHRDLKPENLLLMVSEWGGIFHFENIAIACNERQIGCICCFGFFFGSLILRLHIYIL